MRTRISGCVYRYLIYWLLLNFFFFFFWDFSAKNGCFTISNTIGWPWHFQREYPNNFQRYHRLEFFECAINVFHLFKLIITGEWPQNIFSWINDFTRTPNLSPVFQPPIKIHRFSYEDAGLPIYEHKPRDPVKKVSEMIERIRIWPTWYQSRAFVCFW